MLILPFWLDDDHEKQCRQSLAVTANLIPKPYARYNIVIHNCPVTSSWPFLSNFFDQFNALLQTPDRLARMLGLVMHSDKCQACQINLQT
jgi:hypothetical protein